MHKSCTDLSGVLKCCVTIRRRSVRRRTQRKLYTIRKLLICTCLMYVVYVNLIFVSISLYWGQISRPFTIFVDLSSVLFRKVLSSLNDPSPVCTRPYYCILYSGSSRLIPWYSKHQPGRNRILFLHTWPGMYALQTYFVDSTW